MNVFKNRLNSQYFDTNKSIDWTLDLYLFTFLNIKMNENNDNKDNKIVFKKRKCLGQRRRRNEDQLNDEKNSSSEESGNEWTKLDQLRGDLKSKKRVIRGVNIIDLSLNQNNINSNVNNNKSDIKMGGLMDAKTLSNQLDLGNTFSVETNRRDEDTDLMKYIDEELNKRKATQQSMTANNCNNNKNELAINSSNLNEDLLFSVLPEHLLKNNAKKSEEMLSNQMLNGIPEVELGIEERIRNIEATEDAKMKLIEKKKNKVSNTTSSFVPNNIAVCFVHHNRFNIEEDIPHLNNPKRSRNEEIQPLFTEEPVVVIGDEPKPKILKLQSKGSENQTKFQGKEKASDDYIFEKFKKQFRKF